MAAETVAAAGYAVSVYDAMPSVGRKFLLAGVGGLNITHSEASEAFLARYWSDESLATFLSALQQFDATALRGWVQGLTIETFIGSSGRVFPKDMKAAPLLRAWLHRLRELGVKIYPRHRWLGWSENRTCVFSTRENGTVLRKTVRADVLVLALGGASWQRLGSDGAWVPLLRERGIEVADLQPTNCGFCFPWNAQVREQIAGVPLHGVGLRCIDQQGQWHTLRSEALISEYGIEGTGVYALSKYLREQIRHAGVAQLYLDLLPDLSVQEITQRLAKPRGKNSFGNFLRKQLHLPAEKLAVLRELTSKQTYQDVAVLALAIKNLPLVLTAPRPIDEAISSAGGVRFSELNSHFMLNKFPGVFCVGEMLNWEAPTGGYLLNGCFASGRMAGLGVNAYLENRKDDRSPAIK